METTLYKSQIGLIKITSKAGILIRLDLNTIDKSVNESSEFNNFVIFQLNEYFAQKRKTFDIPLGLDSYSDFNFKVWQELIKIPYGEFSTYKNIAKQIQNEKAYRAVGTAIGKNPIPIIVPCHRVIKANGDIGGFSLGIDIKKKLLKIEQMDV